MAAGYPVSGLGEPALFPVFLRIRTLGTDGNVNLHYINPDGSSHGFASGYCKGADTPERHLLQHLGIRPGKRVDLERMSGGELRLRAARSTGTIDGFLGVLAYQTKKIATLEEINEAAASGWAGEE